MPVLPSGTRIRTATTAVALTVGVLCGARTGRCESDFEHVLTTFNARVLERDFERARHIADTLAMNDKMMFAPRAAKECIAILDALEKRRAAIRTGAASMKGAMTSLKTAAGSRTGKILGADETGIQLEDLAGKRSRIAWSDLTPQQESSFASRGGWFPMGSTGALTRAYIALMSKNYRAARRALGNVTGSILSARLNAHIEKHAPTPKGAEDAAQEPKADADAPVVTTDLNAKVARAVETGLAWLEPRQNLDGYWPVGENLQEGAEVGLTGLTTLCFVRGGSHEQWGPHKAVVKQAVSFLIERQRPNGLIGLNLVQEHGGGYNHAIATLALVEAFAKGKVTRTRSAALKALGYSVTRYQFPDSGWRYAPRTTPDTSVTSWFVAHLAAAKKAGLRTLPGWRDGATSFLDEMTEPYRLGAEHNGRARYTLEHAYSLGCTAAALASRMAMDADVGHSLVRGAAKHLAANLPAWESEATPWMYYYWYQGTMGLSAVGGEHWDAWRSAVTKELVAHQEADEKEPKFVGSWPPVKDGKLIGRVYATALSVLTLEACLPAKGRR